MEKLHEIKDALIDLLYEQIPYLDCICAAEMGEVIDVIKDIYQACYYHTLIEAMNDKSYTPAEKVAIIKAAQE